MLKAVVHKESTLGLILSNGQMEILHASILKGSTFSNMSGALYVAEKDLPKHAESSALQGGDG